MWRSLFLALGIMALIVGFECLFIDSANLYAAGQTEPSSFIDPAGVPSESTRVWQPKEWFPWSLLCGGAITIVYSLTLPKRFGKGGD